MGAVQESQTTSSFVQIGLKWLQQCVTHASRRIQAWMPIPLQQLEPCIPSRGVQQRQKQPWFTRLELPPRPRQREQPAVA